MGSNWREDLRDARKRLGLSQRKLAEHSGLSYEALRKYETGQRHPSRPHLIALLDALKAERTERNAILEGAGFASDGLATGPWLIQGFMFTAQEAADLVEDQPWPAFVSNEMMEVTAANGVAQRLWGVDLRTELLDALDRNLLVVVSNPRFAERCNLKDALQVMVAVFKGHHRGAETLESPSPYFAAVLQRFFAGERRYIEPFLNAWLTATPRSPKVRWDYPIVWEDPIAGTMRFRCVVSPASEPDGLAFNDWIPTDSETWLALNRLEELHGGGKR